MGRSASSYQRRHSSAKRRRSTGGSRSSWDSVKPSSRTAIRAATLAIKDKSALQLAFLRGPAYSAAVLTPRQLRAARVLIGWSRKVLSERSGVPIKTTEAFERGTTDPKMSTEHKWRRALERAGVAFIEEDETGGVGVRLRERRKPDPEL